MNEKRSDMIHFIDMCDFLRYKGDPAPAAGTTTASDVQEDASMIEQFKMKAAEGVKMFMIGA